MKIELLKTFLEVSHTLHFRIAAENLFLTQSAVSARIKQLEEDLGVALFDRSQKHLKITPEGHRLVKHANDMILMWQKAKQDVGIADSQSMQLVIGAMMSSWDIVLQDWLQKIHRNLDQISLHTHTYSPIELRKGVINRVVDIAFLFEPPFVDDLVTEKVATVPLQLVTTEVDGLASEFETEPINENKVREHIITSDSYLVNLSNFVMVDYGEAINTRCLRDFADMQEVKHFMSQPRMALNYILEAGGSAYLPRQLTFEFLQKGQLAVVEQAPSYSREIFAVYLAKSQKSALIEQALQLFPYVKT